MKHRCTRKAALALAAFCLAAVAAPAAIAGKTYELTITNLTRGQVFSPPVVVTHHPSINLFTPGQPASPELAALAEDADEIGLVALLSTLRQVAEVKVGGGVIPPGESMTMTIQTQGNRRQLSVAGMMVTTNDALYAVSGKLQGSGMLRGSGYDAGSEANTESCDHIPGPPCANPGVRVTDGAEGYVHIHAGIHGIDDLSAAMRDWRNPTVRVTFRELKDDDEDDEDDD